MGFVALAVETLASVIVAETEPWHHHRKLSVPVAVYGAGAGAGVLFLSRRDGIVLVAFDVDDSGRVARDAEGRVYHVNVHTQ